MEQRRQMVEISFLVIAPTLSCIDPAAQSPLALFEDPMKCNSSNETKPNFQGINCYLLQNTLRCCAQESQSRS